MARTDQGITKVRGSRINPEYGVQKLKLPSDVEEQSG